MHFLPLDEEAKLQILDKYLLQLRQRCESQGVRLVYQDGLAQKLLAAAEKHSGARALRRVLQDRLEGPLASWLLRLEKRQSRVKVVWEAGEIRFFV